MKNCHGSILKYACKNGIEMGIRKSPLIMMLLVVLHMLPTVVAQGRGRQNVTTHYNLTNYMKELLELKSNNNVNLPNLTSNLALLHCNVYCKDASQRNIVSVNGDCSYSPTCKQCQCDDLCEEYGDCCPDRNGHLNILAETKYECVGSKGSKLDTYGYFMVTSCPGEAGIKWSDSSDVINPVTSLETEVTYVNYEIAVCNNVTSLVAHWKNTCSLEKPRRTERSLPPTCVDTKPPTGFTARRCNPLILNKQMIETCNFTGMWANSSFNIDVESKCTGWPVYHVVEGDAVFKNIYCFLCNGFHTSSSCGKFLRPTVNPGSINDLVDLNRNARPVCVSGQWYDRGKNVCRRLHCRVGHELRKHDCLPSKVKLTDIEFSFSGYFWPLNSNTSSLGALNQLESLVVQNMPGIMAQIDVFDFLFTLDNMAKGFDENEIPWIVTMTSDPVPEFGLNIEFRTSRNCCREDYEEWISDALSANWTLEKNGSIYEYQSRKEETFRYEIKETSSFKVVSPSRVPVRVGTDISLTNILGMASLNLTVPIMEPSCVFLRLSDDDFKWNHDESINLTYVDIRVPQENITKIDKLSLMVCKSVLEEMYRHYYPVDLLQKAKNIVSFSCSILSLVCLALTFITYCTFPSLLTLPTKNTMCLVVSLFIAQLLIQFGDLAKQNHVACKTIGVLIHYFWLCVIFWMNVCSYHMFHVFVIETTKPIALHGFSKRLFCYFLYANGTSLIIVLATITANLGVSSGTEIGYGDGSCYLSTTLLKGLSFVLPLGIVLIMNGIFFGMSVYTMVKISKMSSTLGKDRNQVYIYIKLSTLTGVFWIFALLDGNLNLDVLSFISIILNTSQGVFIFISYIANKRVLKMWRGKLVNAKPAMEPTVSTISTRPGQYTVANG